MKNILVAIEFDKKDEKLFRKASEFAAKFGSKIWIIHVAEPDPDFVGYDVGPQYIRDFRGKELRKEHRKLQQLTAKLNAKKIKAEGLLVQGATIKTILDESVKLKADLIVMGYHKHGLLFKAFVGSSSSLVIRKSKVPVLIVPFQ